MLCSSNGNFYYQLETQTCLQQRCCRCTKRSPPGVASRHQTAVLTVRECPANTQHCQWPAAELTVYKHTEITCLFISQITLHNYCD